MRQFFYYSPIIYSESLTQRDTLHLQWAWHNFLAENLQFGVLHPKSPPLPSENNLHFALPISKSTFFIVDKAVKEILSSFISFICFKIRTFAFLLPSNPVMTTVARLKTYLDAITISRCQSDDNFVGFQLMGIFPFLEKRGINFFLKMSTALHVSQSPHPTRSSLSALAYWDVPRLERFCAPWAFKAEYL